MNLYIFEMMYFLHRYKQYIALVLPHFDYCNSVLYRLPMSLIRHLQSVQYATARLIFSMQRFEHITSALLAACP